MFQPLALLLVVAAIVTVWGAPAWAWAPLALGVAGLGAVLAGVRSRQYGPLADLSPTANAFLGRFGHFYSAPYAGTSASAAASMLVLGAMAVAVIALLKGAWVSAGVCAALYFAAARLARAFNPVRFLVDAEERAAHLEIVEHFRGKR
jgi:hypothetical protein